MKLLRGTVHRVGVSGERVMDCECGCLVDRLSNFPAVVWISTITLVAQDDPSNAIQGLMFAGSFWMGDHGGSAGN